MTSPEKKPHPASQEKIPFWEKISFGVGCLYREPGLHSIQKLAYPIFNVALGVNPALIGIALAAFRIWDAFTDPVMGWISDSTRSIWGRRKPYVLVGAITSGILFPVVFWAPRGLSDSSAFTYFLVTCLLYFTAFTVFAAPLWGMAHERSADYQERVVLWTYRSFFGGIGMALVEWIYPLTQIDYWEDTVEGIRMISLGMGIFWIFCGIVPAFFMKERFRVVTQTQKKDSILRSLKGTLTCKPFVIINGMQLCLLVGSFMVEFLGFYVNVYHVHGGDTKAAAVIIGITATLNLILRPIFIVFIPALTKRFGKIRLLYVTFILYILFSASKWFLFTPEAPMLQIIVPVGILVPTYLFWTIIPSMISDVCDWDELKSHRRREGMFAAVDQWINKAGVSLSSGLTGFVLIATGFDQALGGNQSASAILSMRILYSAVPICFFIICLILLRLYPLTEDRAHEIRAELEARRGVV